MAREGLDPALIAAYETGLLRPFVAAALTFRSKTEYAWSGRGNLNFGGNMYLGVGTLGRISTVTEGVDIRADGVTVGLSGIDPDLYNECMTDIQQGLPAKLYKGVLSDTGVIVGTPYLFWAGFVDQPHFDIDRDALTITLNLENLMAELQRAPMDRLTSCDQAILYPTDSAFSWVETLNDAPLRWGPTG